MLSRKCCLVMLIGCGLWLCATGCRLTPEQEQALCEAGRGVVCDGLDVVLVDLCAGTNTKLESCEHACHLGECVDCAPQAALVCHEGHVWSQDSCGVLEEKIEDCASGCTQGACTDPSCTPDAGLVCVGNNVYSEDSCGVPGDFVQLCPRGCADGACLDCTPDAYITCYDGDVYSLDSCMQLGAIHEDCPDGSTCQADGSTVSCVSGVTCNPNAFWACFGADLHYVDSCGNVQPEIYQSCNNGCDQSGCLACIPEPVGFICIGSDLYYLVGGCDRPSVPGNFIESCEHGCQLGECLATSCVPNAGTVCVGSDLYAMDSCQVRGDFLENCPHGCTDGRCDSSSSCDPAGLTCGEDDHLHTIDSCGNVGEIVTRCRLTDAQPNCQDGVCLNGECTPHALKGCLDNKVYWMDSCWNTEELAEDCAAQGKVCASGDGSAWCDTGTSCTSHAFTACWSDGNVWWFDSCESPEGIAEECGSGEVCQNGSGDATCVTSSGGPEYSCYCSSDCTLVDAANDFALVAQCDELLMYPDTPVTDPGSTQWLCIEHCGPSAYTCSDGILTYDVAGMGMTVGPCTGCGGSCIPGSPPSGCLDCAMCEMFCSPS